MISPDIVKLIGLVKEIDNYLIEAKKLLLKIAEDTNEQMEGYCSCHPDKPAA